MTERHRFTRVTEGVYGRVCGTCGEPLANPVHNVPPGWEVGGRKDDEGKNRLDLIPPELVTSVGAVLTFGAEKYGDRNWEKGISYSRVFAALMRHAWAWWGGEQNDPETGMSHLWHLGCCVAFLIAFEARGTGKDDRSEPLAPVDTDTTH